MEDVRVLRAHHGVCIRFFEGKGYSDGFTGHMAKVIAGLGPDTPVRVVARADIICERCPNNLGGVCETAEKVGRYDARVLELCGLSPESELSWGEFSRLVEEKIIRPGRRREVCGGCEWDGVCSAAENRL